MLQIESPPKLKHSKDKRNLKSKGETRKAQQRKPLDLQVLLVHGLACARRPEQDDAGRTTAFGSCHCHTEWCGTVALQILCHTTTAANANGKLLKPGIVARGGARRAGYHACGTRTNAA